MSWHWQPDLFLALRRIAKRVPKGQATVGYGYDKENRVVLIYEFGFEKPQKLKAMEFLRYSRDKIVGSHFRAAGGVLADVFEATLAEGCIVRVERLMSNSLWEWKSIEWQGEKIASVLEGMRGRKAHRQITYNGKGEIVDDLDLSEPPKRKPLPKGVTMQSLAKKIRGLLAKTVVTTVTKAKIKEPVYCLALNYDCEGNPLLLPELGIGLDSERKARLKFRSRDARRAIWEPEEFSLFANDHTALQDRDRELDRACDLFNDELEFKASDEPARKLILQVAADLAKVDWTGKLNITDDFIVYAVDTYGNDLRKNLKLSVPPKQLAKLKAAKLL